MTNVPSPLDDKAARIRAAHSECRSAFHRSFESALEIGRLLTEAKAELKHGEFTPYLIEDCGLSERTARGYMAGWRAYQKAGSPDLGGLSLDNLLRQAVSVPAGDKTAKSAVLEPDIYQEGLALVERARGLLEPLGYRIVLDRVEPDLALLPSPAVLPPAVSEAPVIEGDFSEIEAELGEADQPEPVEPVDSFMQTLALAKAEMQIGETTAPDPAPKTEIEIEAAASEIDLALAEPAPAPKAKPVKPPKPVKPVKPATKTAKLKMIADRVREDAKRAAKAS